MDTLLLFDFLVGGGLIVGVVAVATRTRSACDAILARSRC
jgi:hypothetical protein